MCEEPIGVGATDKAIMCECEECACPLCSYTEQMKYGL